MIPRSLPRRRVLAGLRSRYSVALIFILSSAATLCAVALFFLIFAIALARAEFHPELAQASPDPALRKWFEQQLVPGGPNGSRGPCCSSADGVRAEEDIRCVEASGESAPRCAFWVRFVATPYGPDGPMAEIPVDWMEVPPEAVLEGPFLPPAPGSAVVWWFAEWSDSRAGTMMLGPDGKPAIHIRCFKPGSGT